MAPTPSCPSSSSAVRTALLVSMAVSFFMAASAGNFYQDFNITWGDGRAQILDDGDLLNLSMDNYSGSGFESKKEYLFGMFDMQIKLVPGDSVGTITTYYLSSDGPTHDEIDFEFLGNLSGDPYVLNTNVFSQGQGNREQQMFLWFDPTADFHTYSIVWSPESIILSVDGIPIREFKNLESIGVPYPKNQAMKIKCSLWHDDYWGTRGGLLKTDWSQAPFTASYRNFCITSPGASSCGSNTSSMASTGGWYRRGITGISRKKMEWVQKNYMIYDYCADRQRFPDGLPPECTANSPSSSLKI